LLKLGILRKRHVIFVNRFACQGFGVRLESGTVLYGFKAREFRDYLGVTAFQVPEVMQVAVGEDDKAHILRAGISAGLLFAV